MWRLTIQTSSVVGPLQGDDFLSSTICRASLVVFAVPHILIRRLDCARDPQAREIVDPHLPSDRGSPFAYPVHATA